MNPTGLHLRNMASDADSARSDASRRVLSCGDTATLVLAQVDHLASVAALQRIAAASPDGAAALMGASVVHSDDSVGSFACACAHAEPEGQPPRTSIDSEQLAPPPTNAAI